MRLLLSAIVLLLALLALRYLRLRYAQSFTAGRKRHLSAFLLTVEALLGTITGWLMIAVLFEDPYYAGMLRSAYVLLLLLCFTWLYGKDVLAAIILRMEGNFRQGTQVAVGQVKGEVLKYAGGNIYVRDAQGWVHKIPCSKLLLHGMAWKESTAANGNQVVLQLPLGTVFSMNEREHLQRLAGNHLLHSPWVKYYDPASAAWQEDKLVLRAELIDPEAKEMLQQELMELLQAALKTL